MVDAFHSKMSIPEEKEQSSPYATLVGRSYSPDEIRVTDPDTGGMKGMKSTRFDLLPWTQLEKVAQHYAKGATKYGEHNWRKGYLWSLSFAALERHAASFWSGEDLDPETQSHHLVAVVFHALALLEFTETHPEKDDRYKVEE